jgi:hypothetical protein
MRALIGAASSAALMLGSAAARAASSFAASMFAAAATDANQSAVPSKPTGPLPITGRPAWRNSRIVAV